MMDAKLTDLDAARVELKRTPEVEPPPVAINVAQLAGVLAEAQVLNNIHPIHSEKWYFWLAQHAANEHKRWDAPPGVTEEEIELVEEQAQVLLDSYGVLGVPDRKQATEWHEGKKLVALAAKLRAALHGVDAQQTEG